MKIKSKFINIIPIPIQIVFENVFQTSIKGTKRHTFFVHFHWKNQLKRSMLNS